MKKVSVNGSNFWIHVAIVSDGFCHLCQPTPDMMDSNPVPDMIHSNPNPDMMDSNPVPDMIHSNPNPDVMDSNPVPDMIDSHSTPDMMDSNPIPDQSGHQIWWTVIPFQISQVTRYDGQVVSGASVLDSFCCQGACLVYQLRSLWPVAQMKKKSKLLCFYCLL